MTEHQYEKLGRTWVSPDGSKRRIYFAETLLADLIGFRYTTYKTGNISSASLQGAKLSNGKADTLRQALRGSTAYFDCVTQQLCVEGVAPYAAQILAGLQQRASAERPTEG